MPASQPCPVPGCPYLKPCPNHPHVPYANAPRRARRGSGWAEQRRHRKVMREHKGICHWCGLGGADQVDHVDPNGGNGYDNLRPIHSHPCHSMKTQQEAARALRTAQEQ